MKKITKTLLMGVVIIMIFTLTACVDYGYAFHFSVVGENGSISANWNDYKPEWEEPSPIFVMGGRRDDYRIEFTAIPDDGYQVKEWTFNGEIVKDNKTNCFMAIVVDYSKYDQFITVEFEPIS